MDFILWIFESVTGLGFDWPNGTGNPPKLVMLNPSRTVTTLAASSTLLLVAWAVVK